MRQIKFRYSIKHKGGCDVRVFSEVFTIKEIEESFDMCDLIAERIDVCTCQPSESSTHCECWGALEDGEFEIIARDQLTGLTDKNGVKICEGDIMRCSDLYLWVVKWNDENCGFMAEGEDISTINFDAEVIGNIHQNKEMLA